MKKSERLKIDRSEDDSLGEPYRSRAFRVVFSLFVIAMPILGIISFSQEADAISGTKVRNCVAFFGLYLGYLILTGFLIARIAGRLYKQHRVSKFKFDVQTLLLITVLAALPLGTANGFASFFQNHSNEIASQDMPELTGYFALFLYFLMLPVFFTTESIMLVINDLKYRSRRAETLDR